MFLHPEDSPRSTVRVLFWVPRVRLRVEIGIRPYLCGLLLAALYHSTADHDSEYRPTPAAVNRNRATGAGSIIGLLVASANSPPKLGGVAAPSNKFSRSFEARP